MDFKKSLQMFVFLIIMLASALVAGYPLENDDLAMEASDLRDKRDYGGHGVTGPVHTFVKTDKNANYKWGVRHHVGRHYAGKK